MNTMARVGKILGIVSLAIYIVVIIIMVIAFELFEMLVPSIMLPTLYFLSGLVPLNVAFASWTNTTVWMVLGALILANHRNRLFLPSCRSIYDGLVNQFLY